MVVRAKQRVSLSLVVVGWGCRDKTDCLSHGLRKLLLPAGLEGGGIRCDFTGRMRVAGQGVPHSVYGCALALGCHGSWSPITVRVSHIVVYLIYVMWAHRVYFVWTYRECFVSSQMRHSLGCHTSFYVKQCGGARVYRVCTGGVCCVFRILE